MPEPIDYARAESDDVVRKKFRRRLRAFVVVTVLAALIGTGWMNASGMDSWRMGRTLNLPVSVHSTDGWLALLGTTRKTSLRMNWDMGAKRLEYNTIGIQMARFELAGWPKWMFAVRYRTLLLLTSIPWLITLIRLIRISKKTKSAEF